MPTLGPLRRRKNMDAAKSLEAYGKQRKSVSKFASGNRLNEDSPFYIGGAHNRGPACDFAFDESAELIGPHVFGRKSVFAEQVDAVRRMHALLGRGGKLVDRRARRTGRRHKAKPERRVEVSDSSLRHRRHVGQEVGAFAGRYGECLDLSGSDLADDRRSNLKTHHDAAPDQVGCDLRAAGIGHFHELDAGALRVELAAKTGQAAWPDRAE